MMYASVIIYMLPVTSVTAVHASCGVSQYRTLLYILDDYVVHDIVKTRFINGSFLLDIHLLLALSWLRCGECIRSSIIQE